MFEKLIPVVLQTQLARAPAQPLDDVANVVIIHLGDAVRKAILAVPPLVLLECPNNLRHGVS